MKAPGLHCLRPVKSHVPVRQDVFFDHISQFVGGTLTFFGQPVKSFGQHTHNHNNCRKHQADHQRQFPVEVEQVGHEGEHAQHIAGQPHDGVHQQVRAVLHFVDYRVGNGAGAFIGEQGQLGAQQFVKHGSAQFLQAQVGDPGQPELGDKGRQATRTKQQHQEKGDQPDV